MSLCRWSTSAWYIYEPCGSRWMLEICTFRQVSVVDILRRYSEIEAQAKSEGYGILDRLELRAYLKLWAFWRMKKLTFNRYVRLLNYIRSYGHIRCYVNDPWGYNDYTAYGEGIPKEFQIPPALCNKSLAKFEAKREERRKITESPLMKAMNER
jgi:hypothetical protein